MVSIVGSHAILQKFSMRRLRGLDTFCAIFSGKAASLLRPATLDSLRQLPGLLVFGTFRSTGGKEASKRGLASNVTIFRGSFWLILDDESVETETTNSQSRKGQYVVDK